MADGAPDTPPRRPRRPAQRRPPPPEPGAEWNTTVAPGRELFRENGGSWSVVAIGPVLIAAVLATELFGGGQVNWGVLSIFFLVVTGFSAIQVYAARRHVSVVLTDTTLRQGSRTIALADIKRIYPENMNPEPEKWESAPAIGELRAVPRRRTGIGVRMTSGKLAQAWARDHQRLRTELVQAHLAIQMGLPPRDAD